MQRIAAASICVGAWLAAGSSAAAQPGPVTGPIAQPNGGVVGPRQLPPIDPALVTRIELDRLRAEVDQLKAQVTALNKQAVQASFDSYLLHSLEQRFITHRHRVNGEVGNGFTTTIDGAKQSMTYMMPIRNGEAQQKARETGAPF